MLLNADKLSGWNVSMEKSVGGLEYIGFSRLSANRLICISSQKITVMDCEKTTIKECDGDYDESALLAVCDELSGEELVIAGQYGGELPDNTIQGEHIFVSEKRNGRLVKYKVEFVTKQQKRIMIYDDYGYYTCGFSYDGNYFAFASDAGVCILKRI
ncbi:MAG: hypothetical protein K2H13_05110 [Eubacterium sp.]|nr:hypothetical protein [Eubacterium sp.]MDE6156133.1 hypothetical protein [Eubacterium sp.]